MTEDFEADDIAPASELSDEPCELIVPPEDAGSRLDAWLARHFQRHSRMQLRRIIDAGGVLVDARRTKVAYRLDGGELVTVVLPPLPAAGPNPENIPLAILFEDEHLIAVNKQPGMVVHPARGHWSGTLTSALAFHFGKLSTAGGENRPGIVHRLDRDTSGVIVVAKTDRAHFALAEQFAARTTEKEYFALTIGVPDRDRDMIDLPIGVHPTHREKMAIRADHSTSRPASSFYEVQERFQGFAAVKVLPKTGRTHQIRVHLASIGCPVLCDRLYSSRAEITRGFLRRNNDDSDNEVLLERQALHARRLRLAHPETGEPIEFVAPLPADIEATLAELRRSR